MNKVKDTYNKLKDILENYGKERLLAWAIAVVFMLCTTLILVSLKDTESDSIDVEKELSSMQGNRIPNTGLYPADNSNFVYQQVDKMISSLEDMYGIDAWKLSVIYRMLELKPIYIDKAPNIYTDLSITELNNGETIAIQKYSYFEGNIPDGADTSGNTHNLADVYYSVVNEFAWYSNNSLGQNQYLIDDNRVKYFIDDDKAYIEFALTVMDFFGYSEYKDQFCTDYKMLLDLLQGGNITTKALYTDNSRNLKFNSIVLDNAIEWKDNSEYISMLARVLSGNHQFISQSTFIKNYEEPTIPQLPVLGENEENKNNKRFEYHKATRENMMIAAASLVGKVRYVWAGGHGGGAQIAGANPLWEKFNEAYKVKDISGCIMSSSSECPIHGSSSCAYHSPHVDTIEDYIETWKKQMENHDLGDLVGEIDMEHMYSVFRDRNTVGTDGDSLALHNLDGLDCSGFTCWLYNQIDSDHTYDTVAVSFAGTRGIQRIPFGDKLYPGDAIGWDTHIIVIFGEYSPGCYITVEQTPDVLRFGACCYSEGSKDLEEAGNYADELNALAGIEDDPCMRRRLESYRYRSIGIGRLQSGFEDDGVVIEGYDKEFKELNAREIIEYIGYGM